jgi:hypothetical protein
VKDVGEPGAGEPHARIDGRGLETERHSVTAPVPDPTNLRGAGEDFLYWSNAGLPRWAARRPQQKARTKRWKPDT